MNARQQAQYKCRDANALVVLAAVVILNFNTFSLAASTQSSSGSSSSEENVSATSLLRKTVDAELRAQAGDHSHWMYEVQERAPGKDQVKVVVETRDGEIDRLRSVNGQPLAGEQKKREDHRIEKYLHTRDEELKRKHAQQEDDQRIQRLFKLLPDVVKASYGQRQGSLVEILFEPNPGFRSTSHEATVFHNMRGRMWIDTRDNRLAEIEGHLMREVKFGGGLLGHLDKDGEFHVKQSEVAPTHWVITLLRINMRGKALFFKTIAVQENETRTNFRRVADNMTLAEAAEELQKQCAGGNQSSSGSP